MATSLLTTATYVDNPLIIGSGDMIYIETVVHLHSAQTPDGNLSNVPRPTSSIAFWGYPGVYCYLKGQPVTLDSGILLDLGGCSDNILWLDS